jgi:hypothetical protein
MTHCGKSCASCSYLTCKGSLAVPLAARTPHLYLLYCVCAAAVLKDADKKAAYDSYGHAGVDGSMGGGPQGAGGDPFAEFFRQQQSSAGGGQQMNTDFFEQVLIEYIIH